MAKSRSLSEVEKIIEETLVSCEKETKKEERREYNVAGVIIYGSYIKGKQRPDSDLDLFYLLRQNESPTDPNSDSKHYESRLRARLRIDLDSFYKSIKLDNTTKLQEILYGKDDLILGKFILVTPHKEVKENIAKIKPKKTKLII